VEKDKQINRVWHSPTAKLTVVSTSNVLDKLRPILSMHMGRLSVRPRISESEKDLVMNETNTMNDE
jgi:hypothetical protein